MSASSAPLPAADFVEVDEGLGEDEDLDSTYGSETGSLTDTLHSDMLKYRFENGRRYNASRDGLDYFFPNDETEQDRLDVIHHMTDLVQHGRLHLAPIDENPQRILDMGTGTGIWAIDIGDQYPSAEVIGIDLSPIQPRMVPPNVKFQVDDMEQDWTFNTPFDFIHSRYLATAIQDWPRLVRQAYDNLRPGGWVEFCDYDYKYKSDDGTLTDDLAMTKNDDIILDTSRGLGREPCPGPKLKEWLQQGGFTNVVEHAYKLPIGPWAKDPRMKKIGVLNQMQFLDGVEAWSMALLTGIHGWSKLEVIAHVAEVRNDAQNMKIHAYYNMYVVYGQKPKEHRRAD